MDSIRPVDPLIHSARNISVKKLVSEIPGRWVISALVLASACSGTGTATLPDLAGGTASIGGSSIGGTGAVNGN